MHTGNSDIHYHVRPWELKPGLFWWPFRHNALWTGSLWR